MRQHAAILAFLLGALVPIDAASARDFDDLMPRLPPRMTVTEEVTQLEGILNADTNRCTDPSVVERLAFLHASTGATARALALLDGMFTAQQSPDTYAAASGIALTAGNKERANRWADEAVRRSPVGRASPQVGVALVSLGRHRQAIAMAFPLGPGFYLEPDYRYRPLFSALVEHDQRDILREALVRQQASSPPTNAAAWRQLAICYEMPNDYTNAAACWKRVVELTKDEFDYQAWLRVLGKTDNVEARLDAMTEYVVRKESSIRGKIHWFEQLTGSPQVPGHTNRLAIMSDVLLVCRDLDIYHQKVATVFDTLDMPERAIRHLEEAMLPVEKKRINGGEQVRLQLLSILLKYRLHDKLVDCLSDAAGHAGAIALPRETLAQCVKAIGNEKWSTIVATGEAPGATVTQQIMAVYMLTGSNLNERARKVLVRAYVDNPDTAVFGMLIENYTQARDHAAVFSLYTNRLDRVPALRRDHQFMLDLLFSSSKVNPAAAYPLARQFVADLPSNSYAKWQTEQWFLITGYHDDAFVLCTNILSNGKNFNVFRNLVTASEHMTQPAKGIVSAFYYTQLHKPEYSDDWALDSLASRSGAMSTVIDWAETVQNGKFVDCPFADKVDWNQLYRWAVKRAGDNVRLAAIRRRDFEKDPSPAAARALASALFKIGSVDEAIALQTQALKETPRAEQQTARMGLIRMLVADRRYATARAMVEESLASTTDESERKTLDDIRTEITTGERQDEFVQKTVNNAELAPTDGSLQRTAAQSLRLTGRHLKAAEYYRRALAIQDQTATRWDLASTLSSARQHKEAIDEYRILLERSLSDQEHDSAVRSIAESYDALGDPRQTLEFLLANIDGIKTANVRNWAAARIKVLRTRTE